MQAEVSVGPTARLFRHTLASFRGTIGHGGAVVGTWSTLQLLLYEGFWELACSARKGDACDHPLGAEKIITKQQN